MKNIRQFIFDLNYSDLKSLFAKHLLFSKENNRTSGIPKWHEEPGTLNVIGIRCNSETEFNFGKYNDYLILIFNNASGSFDEVILEVTVDPCRNKEGIAHLRQGVWNSYKVRVHRNVSRYFDFIGKKMKRWALCQDVNPVEIIRTNGDGKVMKTERGFFGINIHDNGGYADSSLGCTILKDDREDYFNKYLPYLIDPDDEKYLCSNHSNITYCLINYSQLEKYYKESPARIERAEAVNGTDVVNEGAVVATNLVRDKEAGK